MPGVSKIAYNTNSAHGTECYRAPELISGTQAIVSMKSDIWALGCVTYELLSGTMAFLYEGKVREYFSNEHIEIAVPTLPVDISAQSRQCIGILLNQLLAREWWKRPSAAEILDLLNSTAGSSTQVYLGVKENGELGHSVGLDAVSDLWKRVAWKQYWFATCTTS